MSIIKHVWRAAALANPGPSLAQKKATSLHIQGVAETIFGFIILALPPYLDTSPLSHLTLL